MDYHDRGVWWEMLCLMHESERRGVLILNGQAMSEEALGRLLGLDKQILTTTLTNLLTSGVASREEETGAIYSRRMVKDEYIRKVRSEAGSKGGNPHLLNQIPTTRDKQISTPSARKIEDEDEDEDLLPEMVAQSLRDNLQIAVGYGPRSLSDVVTQVAVAEQKAGRSLKQLAANLERAVRRYNQEKGNLQIQWGLEKFIGEGMWRDPDSWPRKNGNTAGNPKLRMHRPGDEI